MPFLREIELFLQNRTWKDVLDVAVVSFFLYRLLLLIRGTQAVQIVVGFLLLGLVGLVAKLLDLRLISWLFQNAAPALIIGVLVLFQPEIRRALDQFGRMGFLGRPLAQQRIQVLERMVDKVTRAAQRLVAARTGALIVFERETGLENYANSGIRINGELSPEFLEGIFYPNSPLHDGAAIIRGERILAAGCLLPLAEDSGSVRERIGTRHRAALGLSLQTDAVVLVLSEESGQMAVAHEGKIMRNLDQDRLRQVLISLLLPRPEPGSRPRTLLGWIR